MFAEFAVFAVFAMFGVFAVLGVFALCEVCGTQTFGDTSCNTTNHVQYCRTVGASRAGQRVH